MNPNGLINVDALDKFVTDRLGGGREWVGPGYDHETIREALDAADGPCALHVGDGFVPDGKTVIDSDFPVALVGRSPVASRLGDVEVRGRGPGTYGSPVYFNRLAVDGTLKLVDAPQTMLSDVVLTGASHGLHVASETDDWGSYGIRAQRVYAVNNSGDGFRLDTNASTHSSHFVDCLSQANKGAGYRIRGYANSIRGGTVQLNHGAGVDVRAPACTVRDAYVEGNGRAEETPVEIYGQEAHGLSVKDCYFHGINPRSTTHDHKYVQRAVNVHESKSVSVVDNSYRKYPDAFVKSFGAEVREVGNLAL